MRLRTAVAFIPLLTSAALGDTVFHCSMNATASRDYRYVEEPAWCGPTSSCGGKSSFGIKLFTKPEFDELSYREFLISLDSKSEAVTVKSFWSRDEEGKPMSEEFVATVVSQSPSVVLFVYVNPIGNKVHSYALHLGHKRLVATSVINGVTSLLAQARTFDCE